MLYSVLKAEFIKLRRSIIWLVIFILPIISAVLGTSNYLLNQDILTNGWFSLWTQHTLFLCYFFLPAMFGVFASYLWQLEHQNHNWNLIIASPIPRVYHFLAKFIAMIVFVIFTQSWIGILFILSGKLSNVRTSVPDELGSWIYFGILAGSTCGAIQLCISMMIKNFATPVGLALIGGIIGLAFYAKGYGNLFPYSLLEVGMQANVSHASLGHQGLITSCAFYTVISITFAYFWMKNQDV